MTHNPLAVDLFSGVGGLSLSAAKAGFNLHGAIEIEDRALESHRKNFPSTLHYCTDISKLTGDDIRSEFKIKRKEVGVVIGGPPCQGFSSMGRRDKSDRRNQLFTRFFRVVSELKPVFFLAENVPGILDSQYASIRKRAFRFVEDGYQLLDPLVIKASDFGAATTRTRIFFIGVRQDIRGFNTIATEIENAKSANVTIVNDALAGLPTKISEDWQSFESSWRMVNSSAHNSYVKILNSFYDGIGDQASIERYNKKSEVSGCFGTRHTPETLNRFVTLLPGQRDSVSKSQRLKSDGYCPTIRAGTDNTKGSYQAVRPVHPTEHRVITPREAARLQGFPDWFQFHETKWHSFRQVGNSVCPIAAAAVLGAIKKSLSM